MARSTTSSSTPTPKITAEALRKRLAELKAAQEQAMANYNAYQGAIQDCEHWLAVVES